MTKTDPAFAGRRRYGNARATFQGTSPLSALDQPHACEYPPRCIVVLADPANAPGTALICRQVHTIETALAIRSNRLAAGRYTKTHSDPDYVHAIIELHEAAQLAPDNARYAYVYAIALHAAGQSAEALRVLRYDQQMHPADVDVLIALVTISRDTGDLAAARDYAEQLLRVAPNNPQARALFQSLGPAQ